MFQHVKDGDRHLLVLVLRLRSGEEVALVATGEPGYPGEGDREITLRSPEPVGPEASEQMIAAFRDATGFGPQDLTPLGA
jgi:hypothetical protein